MYILGMTQKMMVNMTTSNPMNLKEWCIVYNRQYLIDEYSTKNAKPMEAYTYGSRAKVLWHKVFPNGLHAEWEQPIKSRTIQNYNCPYESGKAVLVGFNDLKTWCIANNRQNLIDEYSPKNAKPMEAYTYGSKAKVLWHKVLPNGLHVEWEQSIKDRTIKNCNCLYEAGKAVVVGFNDLTSTHPELAKEWNLEKNGGKQPCNYTYGSHEKVWWVIQYIDPVTRELKRYEWEQRIKDRAIKHRGCPFLKGSMMERFTYDYLMKNNIYFKKEYKVSNIGNKRFDIFIPSLNKIIELDWIQHFTDSKEVFENGDTPFNKRVENDNQKNNYCKLHNIELLRVPYFVANNEDDFTKILNDFIFADKINAVVVDYYKQFELSNYLK